MRFCATANLWKIQESRDFFKNMYKMDFLCYIIIYIIVPALPNRHQAFEPKVSSP